MNQRPNSNKKKFIVKNRSQTSMQSVRMKLERKKGMADTKEPRRIKEILRTLLKRCGYNECDLAKALQISKGNLSRKGSRNTYTVYDLTRFADLTGLELQFCDKKTGETWTITTENAMNPLPYEKSMTSQR